MKFFRSIGVMMAMMMTAAGALAGSYETGLRQLSIQDLKGDRHIDGFLWYPTSEREGKKQAHGNVVWEPIMVIPDAAPAAGKRPLVVLSHGMFGNARNQAWLARKLTQEGYIVAAINHPGTSTLQRDPKHRRELWQRQKDISRTIDHVMALESIGVQVNPDRIFMAGHSLGGFTAVALAGGRFDPQRVDASCEVQPEDVICDMLNDWDVAKTPEDRIEMAKDLSDPRIAGFVVFDLGGTQTFSPESLRAIDRPMFVIGAPMDIRGLNLDVESRALRDALSEGVVRYLEPKTLAHFDFLGVCTERALDLLKEEEPDDAFVCINGQDERRAEHEMIGEEVMEFLAGIGN